MDSYNHKHSHVENCRIIDFRTEADDANGRLSVMENIATAPFKVKRVFFVYDIPAGAERGGHSHYTASEIVIPLCGSFDVVIDDGKATKRITLNRPDRGLLITAGIWRVLDNFSSSAVCLALAPEKYDESDYVRDYDEFKKLTAYKQ